MDELSKELNELNINKQSPDSDRSNGSKERRRNIKDILSDMQDNIEISDTLDILKDNVEMKIVGEVCDEFTQSQGHGFIWENDIREKVFGLKANRNDTNVHDISSEELGTDENISIKATNCDTVYCGDIIRFAFGYDFSERHTMIIVQYKQEDGFKKINHIYEINYDEAMNNFLFGDLKKEDAAEYISRVKKEGREFDYKTAARMLERDNSLKATIHPKVDSGSQRRVQTSFKISMIEKDLSGNIISKSPVDKPNLLRGKEITLRIKSSSRTRHKSQTKKKETIPKPKKQTVKKETTPKTKNISKKQLKDIINDARTSEKNPNFKSISTKNKDELEKVIIQEIEQGSQLMKDAVKKHRNKLKESIVSPIFEIKETPIMESQTKDEDSELSNLFSNLDIKESVVSTKESSTPPVRSTHTITIKKPSETKGSGKKRKTRKRLTVKKKTK